MTVLFEADATGGFTAGGDLLAVALRALRTRALRLCEDLDVDDWPLQSRCRLWSVHDVVRHVGDGCRIHLAGLHGDPAPFSGDEPFDARETPRRWLERTAGQTPRDSLSELRECAAAEDVALTARLAEPGDGVVSGPFGKVHWTVLTGHVFWDAWLHARDVTEIVGRGPRSTPVEDGVAALTSLLTASMPAFRMKRHFALTVALVGGDGTAYTASVRPGRVTLTTAEAGGEPDLHGELEPVADALAGRGSDAELALHGDRSVLEPLTWLRSRLLPPGG